MRSRVAVAGLALLLSAPWSALATHRDLTDPNDTRGVLDVRRVKTSGRIREPMFKVVTFRRWSARRIWDRGFALVYFDTFGDGAFDYYALARSTGARIDASLWRDRSGEDRRISRLDAWRANRRSLTVRVPLRRMRIGRQRLVYRWYAQTLWTGGRCRRVCFDFVPNRGAVREPNGRRPPTPTPTPTPTVSPTVTPSP